MPAVIALLRGVNVGGNNIIKMETLRSLCGALGLKDAQTYVQSGNVVFGSKAANLPKLAAQIESAIEAEAGFRPSVILRTAAEWKDAVARNPFAGRNGIEPGKLLLYALASDPGDEARARVRTIPCTPEELHIHNRELYIYFPNGQGRPKLSMPAVERALKVPGSGRNWNTVLKLLAMAEALDAK